MPDEQFKPVIGYESTYAVSTNGRVMNVKTRRLLCRTVTKCRQLAVSLYRHGKTTRVPVARLVATAFLGSVPAGWTVRFRNGNRRDCRAANLNIERPDDAPPAQPRAGRRPGRAA